ncbi:gliding motility-associated ABC transporter ATP-binding subunit GldA [Prolixibacteraceae bacterium JC049]|nr:gliding motility-associated ABC transporter ATP-binding subunit GldA [Prolixibacteraceae bacterium JC049]
MSIKAVNVSKIYGEQEALKSVNFEIESGQIVGFLGPNGAGKSTMMKIITGYLPASNGSVYINDQLINGNQLAIRKQIGYLPEHNPLYLDMYVKEYLLFIANIYKINQAKNRVQEMVELVGLTKEQHKKIGTLSKGYRQRVGLAQALIHDPEVLILDEPTTGLDPNQLEEIRDLIKSISQDKTVMLSTHIMQEVEALCNRVIIINNGQIVTDGDVNTIKHAQSNKWIVSVEFAKEVASDWHTDIDTILKAESITNTRFVVSGQQDMRSDIFKWCITNNITLLEMTRSVSNLETAFRNLTQ